MTATRLLIPKFEPEVIAAKKRNWTSPNDVAQRVGGPRRRRYEPLGRGA